MIFDYLFKLNSNTLFLDVITKENDVKMAVYVYLNNEKIYTHWYTSELSFEYQIENEQKNNEYYFSFFIKKGDKIFSTKTPKITPFVLKNKLDINKNEIQKIENAQSVEFYLKKMATDHNYTTKQIIDNFIYNEYVINNIIFTDYIFIRYILEELNISENWHQNQGSLGIVNFEKFFEISRKLDNWYLMGQTTNFTKNFLQALKFMHTGEYTKAYNMFHAVSIPKEYYFRSYFQGLLTFSNELNLSNSFPYEIEKIKINSDKKLGFVFSCNAVYYEKFFVKTINTLIENYKNFDIAIALINLTENEIKDFESKVMYYLNNYNINISYMLINTVVHEKTLSACSRFIMAEELISQKNINLVIVDLDIDFTKESMEIFHQIQQSESIGLSMKGNDKRLIPWVAIAAGASYFPSKPCSHFFLKEMRKYINHNYNINYSWYLDQNALFYAFKMHQKYFPLEKVINIHHFTSTLLTKNHDLDLLQWKRSLLRKYTLNN